MARSYIQKRKNNIIIGTLCAVVLLMSVGYAVFNTMLDITGTSSIKSTWNIHFDETRTTEAITTKVGLSGAEAPSGTVTYSDSLTANLTADLKQPGDEVTYNLVVKNDGNLPAQLTSIEVSDSDNENIIFTNSTQAGFSTDETNLIKVGETLESKASKNIVIRVAYRDATINKAGESSSNLTVKLNFEQDARENSGTVPPTNNVLYAWTTDYLSIGDSVDGIQTTSDPTSLGKDHYLKFEIDSAKKITASYACFVTDAEYCMQGGSADYFDANKSLLQSQETWFTNNGGNCLSDTSYSICQSNAFSNIGINSTGRVMVSSSSGSYCGVDDSGQSGCGE